VVVVPAVTGIPVSAAKPALLAAVASLIAAVAALVSTVAALVAGRLTALLAFTRAPLVALETAVAAPAMAAATVGAVGIELALTGVSGLGLRFRSLGRRTAKKFFYPGKYAAGFFRYLRCG
jgi:hypothetical protein